MRIATWNCYRGECRLRAARLQSLRPDIVVLQECGKPTTPVDDRCIWFGDRPSQGVGVIAHGEWSVEPGPVDPNVMDSVYPVRVKGPVEFHLLAVWAKPSPTYVRAVMHGLDRYREFIHEAPSLVVGDFNSHPRWDSSDSKANHTVLAARLKNEFRLVSAYHAAAALSGSLHESATLYWRWQADQLFHIDYCFIPGSWSDRLGEVSVGSYSDWTDSDHRPLLVEVALEAI